MQTAPSDLTSALRQIGRDRSFSVVVIVTLALGIGATTTFFSILNAFVFRPLPFADPDRLVALRTFERDGAAASGQAYGSVLELARGASVLHSAVAYSSRDINAAMPGGAERRLSTEISGDLFGLLGVSLRAGRSFLPDEYRSHAPVAVIGDAFRAHHFAPDDVVIGDTLLLDGTAHEIVGVAPQDFGFPADTDVWVPMRMDGSDPQGSINVVARLQGGVTLAQANAVLAAASVGSHGRSLGANVLRLRDSMVSPKHRDLMTAITMATFLILLIACANLAGLLAAHLGSRRQEIAVRAALGASRRRIVSQLLMESAVLALAGGAAGTLMAQWGIDLFAATLGRPQGQGWLQFGIDARVLWFAFALSLVTSLLFGLVPALGAARVDLRGVLLEEGHTAAVGPRGRRLRAALVAAQMAVSLGFIAAASSIVGSSMAFDTVGPGFNRDRLVVLHVTLAGSAYDNAMARMAWVDSAVQRISVLPGVSAVTATSHLPLADRDVPYPRIEPEAVDPSGGRRFASLRFVAGNYPKVVGIPVLLGRSFTDAEAADPRTPVVLVNEALARRYWPGADPLGKRVRLPDTPYGNGWLSIAGVLGDVAQRNPGDQPEDQIYLPLAHSREISLVARATRDDAAILMPATRAIAGLDRGLPVIARTMRDVYAWYVRDRETQGFVLGSLGLVALLLAMLGVYAVMSLVVSHERRDLAIRLALGSSNQAVQRHVLGRSLRIASAGIGGGLILAVGLTSLLSGIFFGVRPFDPRTLAGAALLLTATAIFASWWPARRAMKLDPMTVLRT